MIEEIGYGRNKRSVYTKLNVGDCLKAKHDIISKDDIGMSGQTFDYKAFIKDKIYKVATLYTIDFKKVAYVSDEAGYLHIATPETFELI
jgi:hypothetical protein